MSMMLILLCALVVLVLPVAIFTVVGSFEDDLDPVFSHTMAFLILGILLFIPLVIAYFGLLEVFQEAGTTIFDVKGNGCGISQDQVACKGTGPMVGSWLGVGVLVYWMSYKAGTAMNEILK